MKLEHVRPVVVSGKIVGKFGTYRKLQVYVSIKNPFFRTHRTSQNLTDRAND